MKKIIDISTRKEKKEMDPEQIMDSLSRELESAINAMSKAKKVEEKVAYSHIVKNMSESLGVFLNLANDMMGLDYDDDYDDDEDY